jgi:hypothetical protein
MSLDDDIAAWAATVRLPDAEAAAIFQRIVGTPAPASPSRRDLTRPGGGTSRPISPHGWSPAPARYDRQPDTKHPAPRQRAGVF